MQKKHHRRSCLCCPRTEDILPLNTVLYYGFGGYSVNLNGKHWYSNHNKRGRPPTLRHFEKLARINAPMKWEVILNNPLRGATWERKGKNKWVLTETNQGFA